MMALSERLKGAFAQIRITGIPLVLNQDWCVENVAAQMFFYSVVWGHFLCSVRAGGSSYDFGLFVWLELDAASCCKSTQKVELLSLFQKLTCSKNFSKHLS